MSPQRLGLAMGEGHDLRQRDRTCFGGRKPRTDSDLGRDPWRRRVYFFLTCHQIEQTIEHLKDLEARRLSGGLAIPADFYVDNLTFTNATKQSGKVLGECRESPLRVGSAR